MDTSRIGGVLVAAVLAGCASSGSVGAGAASPSSGWHELTTAHLRLDTDLGLSTAQEGAALLEQLYQGIIAAAWNGARLPKGEPIQVVIFSNGIDFERIYGRNLWSVYRGGRNARLVTYGGPSRWEFRNTLNPEGKSNVVVQGLTAILASRVYQSAPPWFLTGLGTYFETLEIDPDAGKVLFGKVNMNEYQNYRGIRSLDLTQLMAWDGGLKNDQLQRAGYQGLSWATIYWLINARPDSFEGLSQAFARGENQQTAWEHALPGLSVSDANRELHQYMQHGNYAYGEVTIAKPSRALVDRALSEAEVSALLQELQATAQR